MKSNAQTGCSQWSHEAPTRKGVPPDESRVLSPDLTDAGALAEAFGRVTEQTERLCDPLAPEDMTAQSMPAASPAKWHLAHTTWFYETMILGVMAPERRPVHEGFSFLFNSYYNSIGPQHARIERGLLTRPTVREVEDYRREVRARVLRLLQGADAEGLSRFAPVLVLGMHHEQQHQELLITDIKHLFSRNPLAPVYRQRAHEQPGEAAPLRWLDYPEGVRWVGRDSAAQDGPSGFSYDNEGPRHRVFLEPYYFASRLTTCGEFLEFMRDGGYERPDHWLSDGWSAAQTNGWRAPLYWREDDSSPTGWSRYTLAGVRPVLAHEPVCHVSFYEADAYARWAGARLPTEQEWETALADASPEGGAFAEDGRFDPSPAADAKLSQMLGDCWEWTASAYAAYPGYAPPEGPVGEYNAKFMCNQMVLRGGSCATPRSHIRATYRNFFPPEARWQFSGFRLARNA